MHTRKAKWFSQSNCQGVKLYENRQVNTISAANNKDNRNFFLVPLWKYSLFPLPLFTISTSQTGDYFQGIWRTFKILIQTDKRSCSQLGTQVVEHFYFFKCSISRDFFVSYKSQLNFDSMG